MKQPWASAVVFGVADVINVKFRPDLVLGDRVAVYAPRVHDWRPLESKSTLHALRGGLQYAHLRELFLGMVTVSRVTRIRAGEQPQSPFAGGPWCVYLSGSVVFMEPFGFSGGWTYRPGQVFELQPCDMPESMGCVSPAEARAALEGQSKDRAADEGLVHPKRPGGYVGD